MEAINATVREAMRKASRDALATAFRHYAGLPDPGTFLWGMKSMDMRERTAHLASLLMRAKHADDDGTIAMLAYLSPDEETFEGMRKLMFELIDHAHDEHGLGVWMRTWVDGSTYHPVIIGQLPGTELPLKLRAAQLLEGDILFPHTSFIPISLRDTDVRLAEFDRLMPSELLVFLSWMAMTFKHDENRSSRHKRNAQAVLASGAKATCFRINDVSESQSSGPAGKYFDIGLRFLGPDVSEREERANMVGAWEAEKHLKQWGTSTRSPLAFDLSDFGKKIVANGHLMTAKLNTFGYFEASFKPKMLPVDGTILELCWNLYDTDAFYDPDWDTGDGPRIAHYIDAKDDARAGIREADDAAELDETDLDYNAIVRQLNETVGANVLPQLLRGTLK